MMHIEDFKKKLLDLSDRTNGFEKTITQKIVKEIIPCCSDLEQRIKALEAKIEKLESQNGQKVA